MPQVSRPEHVTAEWLTDALRAAGALPEGRVVGFESTPVGTGQMGDSVRLRLAYDTAPEGAPVTLVGKFTAADDLSRATGVALRTYETEVRFYQQLVDTVGIRTPRCYLAEVDATSGEFALLLEDLAPAEQGDQLRGCGPDEAALALEELARLHAPRWDDPALGDLEWLNRNTDASTASSGELLPLLFAGFRERYSDMLAPEHMAVGERLAPRIGGYVTHRPRPWAVQHGDYRLDNMLFGTTEGGSPLAVVDWQTVVLGPPLVDASYFLGAGLQPEDRRRHERDLLAGYHRALIAGGVEGYSWDRCWEDYRRFAYAGYLMAVGASMLVQRTERGDEMFMAMAGRHAVQILDLESERLLP